MKFYIAFCFLILQTFQSHSQDINLNGAWEFGVNREYNKKVAVPGIAEDPTQFANGKVWYKRKVKLPDGHWDTAILELKGARFSPEVYVDGVSVSKQNGGMAPTYHLLKSENIKPGKTIILEIALTSLKDLPENDASYIPKADHWRSNISSYLWDDVVLKLSKQVAVTRMTPSYNIAAKTIDLAYELQGYAQANENHTLKVEICDKAGVKLLQKEWHNKCDKGTLSINYGELLKLWTPLDPNIYKLTVYVNDKRKTLDSEQITIGIRQFEVKEKQFVLNGNPCKIAAGTIVWHRWSRIVEDADIIYDTTWFVNNIIKPLKDRGANTLRFHLGTPPERFLDLCDAYGLLVQYEWSFFHGMPASKESLLEQWKNWLDLGMRHPSVVLIHPYNETGDKELKTAWQALEEILPTYPGLVLEDRDVLHVHKYWWSLFENLGLYYDSYNEFAKAIMVDEFGGNYLDGQGNGGTYPTVKEAYLRFTGRNNTTEQRLYHQTIANSRVAEYWRRIGAAGFSPFCIIGSKEDGNHWYMGDEHKGILKPVWNALTAAWSPRSVSIDIWDRNFIPNQKINLPVYYFNDTPDKGSLKVKLTIEDSTGLVIEKHLIDKYLNAYTTAAENYIVTLPATEGKYTLKAELINPPAYVKYPVVSEWKVNIFSIKPDDRVKKLKIAIPEDETELKRFSKSNDLNVTATNEAKADVILVSAVTWKKIADKDLETLKMLEKAINYGTSVIMLDVGDVFLGQGYLEQDAKISSLQGRYEVYDQPENKYKIIKGLELAFRKISEPESHIHADINNNKLWNGIPVDHTWLWNGLRGGLIVPANSMEISGLSQNAFLSKWITKKADKNKIINGPYFAYDLQGFYRFSDKANDQEAIDNLKKEVAFLVEDAPALAGSINPNAPVKTVDLAGGYQLSKTGEAKDIQPLVNSGRNLIQSPVVLIDFGKEKGKLILSQLITNGRLDDGKQTYEIPHQAKYDPVASQFVLNMIKVATEK